MNRAKIIIRDLFLDDLMYSLSKNKAGCVQRSPEYLEWVSNNSIACAAHFISITGIDKNRYFFKLNKVFQTSRFNLLLRRWLVEYIVKVFDLMYDFSFGQENSGRSLGLESNRLNKFLFKEFNRKWQVEVPVKWQKVSGLAGRLIHVSGVWLLTAYLSLRTGLSFRSYRKNFVCMREAIWGLYDVCGDYFHDDFLVDGEKIKRDQLLLFSRGIPQEPGRLKASLDAARSDYDHFDLLRISMGFKPFLKRVVPKYLIKSNMFLAREVLSEDFSLFKSLLVYFITYALPYEKVFSHYEVKAEMGHNYFNPSHIPESIICANHGTRYYLFHWADKSININNYVGSFLSCDGYVIWGSSHIRGVEGENLKMHSFGYIFKTFIKEAMNKKDDLIHKMGVLAKGRIISFFDESFGAWCKMTAEHYLAFWDTAVTLAEEEPGNTVIIHPKDKDALKKLLPGQYERFQAIKSRSEKLNNFFEIDSVRWSFIESIGISDVVVTQGMTSSATIAIICGITGFYLDQAGYRHPFSDRFKDVFVFNEPKRIITAIKEVLSGRSFPLKEIPEQVLRGYDEFPDERGIGLLRDLIVSKN